MKIAVLIKQVPETDNLRLDEKTGTVIRKGIESIVNPLDLYAIETALRIKDNLNNTTITDSSEGKTKKTEEQDTTVTVITMGPPDAERALREALSMGCDNGILITGREFAGSDTFATSLVLSRVILQGVSTESLNLDNSHHKLPFDLILCGERATDGDTGQVGPAVASFLELPVVTYVSRIGVNADTVEVDRIVEDGVETYRVTLPALITVSKAIGTPRLPTLSGKKRAKKAEIKIVNFTEELFKQEEVGLKGSPTRVVKIFRPQIKRKPTIVTVKKEADIEIAVDRLINFIAEDIDTTE